MKRFNTAVIALVCALAAPHASAFDPLSLIVLRMLRDQLVTTQLEAALASGEAQAAAPTASRYPRDLRAVIDQGFPHLDAEQRRSVYERLTEMMNDPQNAAQRDVMLNEFLNAASASRRTHEALAHLTDMQKRMIATQAAAAYRDKEPQALQQAINLLRTSAMPLPSDLRELMLAEFTAESARTALH